MGQQIQTPEVKPGKVQAVTIMLLVNGILNILWSFGFTIAVIFGSLGIGLLCAPITLMPGVLGIFEIIAAANLLSTPAKPVKNFQIISILEIVTIVFGNVISMIVGILNLILYNDIEVRSYFTELENNQQ
ncbi:MAG: hypothetical protein JEZ06_12005 [Anaerolineaceae bacterium]|nr:hypothetical protein [Anaerolineaceae bacterium]